MGLGQFDVCLCHILFIQLTSYLSNYKGSCAGPSTFRTSICIQCGYTLSTFDLIERTSPLSITATAHMLQAAPRPRAGLGQD